MIQEPANEYHHRQGNILRLPLFPVSSPYGYSGAVVIDDAAVGDGCLEGIPRKILYGVAIAVKRLDDFPDPVRFIELTA